MKKDSSLESKNDCMHRGGECMCVSPAACENQVKNCHRVSTERDQQANIPKNFSSTSVMA